MQCDKNKPCQLCIKAGVDCVPATPAPRSSLGSHPTNIPECLPLETDLFADDAFAYPTFVLEYPDPQVESAVSEFSRFHGFQFYPTDTCRLILTHEDFRVILYDDTRCNFILETLKYDIGRAVCGIEDWNCDKCAFANVISLSESIFGKTFVTAIGDLLEHHSQHQICWAYNSTKAFTEAPCFEAKRLQASRDRWNESGKELLRLLHDYLHPTLLRGYDTKKGTVLLFIVLFTMILAGKARSSLKSKKVLSLIVSIEMQDPNCYRSPMLL